jgi:DNA-binding MarR family transcriptional regulator
MWIPNRIVEEQLNLHILEIFVDNIDDEMSGPIIRKMLNVSPKTLYSHLKDFETKGYITFTKKTGRTNFYKLNLQNKDMIEIVKAENTRIITELNHGLEKIDIKKPASTSHLSLMKPLIFNSISKQDPFNSVFKGRVA